MASCSKPHVTDPAIAHDIHSYGHPDAARIRHIALDLEVLFDQHTIRGTAVLTVDQPAGHAKRIVLDSRALQIDETEISPDGAKYQEARFDIGKADPILGAPLTIDIAPDTKFVRIRYSTSPGGATALQWLAPEQTAGKTHPFLYTQSQAIHARSWIPLQDSPGLRLTWDAHVRVPAGLKAVMSGIPGTDSHFRMDHPVPPYLIALAVGDLGFQSTGPRTGVWAEPALLAKSADEFSGMEQMLETAEKLYGPYRWTRYDVLVLPPSFPFGGMENPCLTFVTPTILAGDRSLVSLIAHELAHSWSGNLVTNATWSDFWLNEGYTVYIERRILEEIFGPARANMEAVLGYRELQDEIRSLPARDQFLYVDLKGRDPDDGATLIPYEKGALFLAQLEEVFGREKFDAYLKAYFDHFAFQSVTTAQSLAWTREHLFAPDPQAPPNPAAAALRPDDWLYQPGLPASAPQPHSQSFDAVDRQIDEWTSGRPIHPAEWSPQEWEYFLRGLPAHLTAAQMQSLDREFHLTASGNNEILSQWLLMSVRNHYAPADARLEEFLTTVGRRKYVKPLYSALDPKRAAAIYEKARPLYHPITQTTIDALLAAK